MYDMFYKCEYNVLDQREVQNTLSNTCENITRFAPVSTQNSAASLGCVKCRLLNKTQYGLHLFHGDSCGLPDVREVQIIQ